MSFIITLLAAVFVFSAVIAIHEFGHFAVAKLCGVQVNEFSIGMGPVLLKKMHHGTSTASGPCRWAVSSRWKGRRARKANRPKERNARIWKSGLSASALAWTAPLTGEP